MQNMREAYEEYFHTVYGFLMGLTGGDADLAEELTQETFYRAVKNSAKFRGECKMSTWLCQIAKYAFYQHLDKKKRRGEIPLEELTDTGIADSITNCIEDELIENEGKLAIYKKIQALPSPAKDVFLLRLTGDLSFREIGNIFGKTENWARVTYYRGKQILGRELEKDDI